MYFCFLVIDVPFFALHCPCLRASFPCF